ncbi:MAG: hypothetical protein JRH06_09365 [Deltaproteobacteria bacterium]|nr:hypothetical protein [Deltaproteobacteria bacterium]MBW2137754.1 hypothetical protein [Deltaproteobacteria bacterium]
MSNFLIDYQCPQCGAPATLQETDHLFACEFCKVKSYLLSRVYRYLLPNSAPEGKELIYLPYWRFKGMLFSCVPDGIQHRIVDVSHLGLTSPYFPPSLGLRSQTLKLKFVSPDTKGVFLRPSLKYQEAEKIIEERLAAVFPKPIYTQGFIGEALSIIYSPFYVNGRVYDAVLNRSTSPDLPPEFDISQYQGGPANWEVKFVPALCPHCGWDLDGERDSLALDCVNCNSVWFPGKEGFANISFAHIPVGGDPSIFLPFWRIKARTSGIALDSYADLVKVANLPKVVQEEWKSKEFRFWAPAFKVRPESFMKFSRNLTLSQPDGDWPHTLPDAPLYPVTLPVQEAAESLKLTLASFIKPPGIMYPRLPDIEIDAESFFLVYVPFHERGMELYHEPFRLRINKNLLAYARHL